MIKRVALVAIALMISSFGSQSLQAQDSGFAAGVGLGYSGLAFQGSNSLSQRRIPYFALHPPVYYGQKVARPYGVSPFATPPTMMPAEMQLVPKAEFKEITNPFFKGKAKAAPVARRESDKTT